MPRFFRWMAGLALGLSACLSFAQTFPDRPVRLIVPWPAGGSTDVSLRVLASIAARHLGQPIVVENRPGAAGTLGVVALAQIPMGVFRVPHMQKVGWDPLRDITYLIGVSGYTYGLVVRADAPWKTLKEYLDDARKRPDEITYGTAGVGGTPHLNTEQLASAAGVRLRHVPFKGTADNLQALLGGHVMSASEATGWAPYVDSGQLRLLATWGAERTARWPQVPTLKELGYGLVSSAPYGIGAPAGMDPRTAATLHDAFHKAMQDPEHLAVLARYDQPLIYMSSADYTRFARESFAAERALVERLGLRENK